MAMLWLIVVAGVMLFGVYHFSGPPPTWYFLAVGGLSAPLLVPIFKQD